MWLEFEKYSNGNTKVLLCNPCHAGGEEISCSIERLPDGVAYILDKYKDYVKLAKKHKKYDAANNNKYHQAYSFA